MPENESLHFDARRASRWRPYHKRLDDGETLTSLFPDIQRNFFTMGQKVWKHWKGHGIAPTQLFDAALNNQKLFRDLTKQGANDPYIRLLGQVAAALQRPDRDLLVLGFLSAVWDEVEFHLQINRREDVLPLKYIENVQNMMNRILSSLLKNLSRFPNQPGRIDPPPDLDSQLSESLL